MHLSTETNAHVELTNMSNYPLALYLNTSIGEIFCIYSGDCNSYNTCIASVSTEFTGDSNLHIADCTTDPYATKICCNLTVAAENKAPTIDDISNIPSQSITEDNLMYIDFSVLASDQDGVSQLNDTSLNATFFLSGEELKSNLSCSFIEDLSATQANYSCRIGVWYWDASGVWNVNATIKDTNDAVSSPYNETFVLGTTTSVKMSPAAITWPITINLGNTNILSTNFLTLNNSGNDDIASENVRVNAVNLTGEANSNYFIRAGNFSSNVAQACEGTQLVENSAAGISSSILAAGNHSIMNNVTGQEVLFFCAETIPTNIIVQSYSTNKTGKTWTVDVYS